MLSAADRKHRTPFQGDPHGKTRETYPRRADQVRHRRRRQVAVQMRPLEEPAVLRPIAQAGEGRGSRQAVLVRRRRHAPRSEGRVSADPLVLRLREEAMPFFIQGETSIYYEQRGRGYPLLLLPPGG